MKRVDPKVYTKEYYLNDCSGFKEFKKSNGNLLEPRLVAVSRYLSLSPKTKILDIGCGRGEMVIYCAKKGAESVGIDYSEDGIKLALKNLKKQPIKTRNKVKFYKMDAKKLKFKSSYFDIVILTDVVEHLYDWELNLSLKEVNRVLKKDGVVVMHTAPNKLFNDIGYKYYCYPIGSLLVKLWNYVLKRSYPNIAKPEDLRTDSHRIMHINEPTYLSLKKIFKASNFVGKITSTNITAAKPSLGIQDNIFNFVVYFHPISKYFPMNIIFGSDFISILRKRK